MQEQTLLSALAVFHFTPESLEVQPTTFYTSVEVALLKGTRFLL